MNLNIECLRDILLSIEEKPLGKTFTQKDLEEKLSYSSDDIYYCCYQIKRSNLAEIDYREIQLPNKLPIISSIGELTPYGHQFLENIKSDDIWNKTKEQAKKVGSFSLKSLIAIAEKVISTAITNSFLH